MSIQVGDKIPEATFRVMTESGPDVRSSDQVFKGRKVVLFAVPGAFTPTCHLKHLPGFLEEAAQIKAKGVDAVALTAVNDVFVLNAWVKSLGDASVLEVLSDGNGEFARALDLVLDGTGFGMGHRSKRYAMIVEDGVITTLNVEENAGQADTASAANILKSL
jgi:glutaredoxin/glutathione-dependent peroxiredoxin